MTEVTPPPATRRVLTKAPAKKAVAKKTPARRSASADPAAEEATDLLVRAIRVGLQKGDDDWVYAAGVKSQMQRMDPAFTEKSLGSQRSETSWSRGATRWFPSSTPMDS